MNQPCSVDNGWDDHALPCGCRTRTYRVASGGLFPIGMGPYPGLSASIWCPEHGWVNVTDEEFAKVKEVCGGIA